MKKIRSEAKVNRKPNFLSNKIDRELQPDHASLNSGSYTRVDMAGDYRSPNTKANQLFKSKAKGSFEAQQQFLGQLQKQYGNHHVQRVLDLSRKGGVDLGVSTEIVQTINRKRGGGQALDRAVRGQMEPTMGADFSGVRVHTDGEADNLNQQLNARAFATGQDIFFRQGNYNPGSSTGRELIAHELTHVIQQTGNLRRKMMLGQPGDKYEQEADNFAEMVVKRYPVNNKNKSLTPSTLTAEKVQRVIDPISAAGLGVAVFGLVASLVPYGTGGLQWKRNIGKAIHNWPPGREPEQRHWVRDYSKGLIDINCISGLSSAWGFWHLRWNYNGADIDQAHVYKFGSSSWSGGSTGSAVNITFEMQDASASYESGGKAAMICYISGTLDPVGAGDIDFEARVLIYADGTTRKLGSLDITRGDASDFTITSWQAGWSITKD